MFLKEIQMKLVEKKTIMSKMKNTFARYLVKLAFSEETNNNLEDIRIEIVQNKTQRKTMEKECLWIVRHLQVV